MKTELGQLDVSGEKELFGVALGLRAPWGVDRVEFLEAAGELHLHLSSQVGVAMSCAHCGVNCPVHDRGKERVWRHLNFFQHQTFLHARPPRVRCAACGIKTVDLPWARPGSGFTLLFEAFVLLLARLMPVAPLARLLDENDTRLWRVLAHFVARARAKVDMSAVEQIGADETSIRGHEYVTVVADQTEGRDRRVLFVTEGKDASTIKRFKDDLISHGGKAAQISAVSMDMSPAFQKGVKESFPNAKMIFDRFHVMKLINEALDQVRRQEVRHDPALKHSRFLWLINPENLSEHKQEQLKPLKELNLTTATAYQMKLNFQEFWQREDRAKAEIFLNKWCQWVLGEDVKNPGASPESNPLMAPMRRVARTIRKHANGILNYFPTRLTNGLLEGINSLIQAAKSKARGYRSTKYLKIIIYLVAGKLDFGLPRVHAK